jgi:glycosyltransferase involved in cell wall biosynthesis
MFMVRKSSSSAGLKLEKTSESTSLNEVEGPDFRIVMIMPHRWRGGMLKVGIETCNLLEGLKINGRKVRASFAVPAGYDLKNIIGLNPSIPVIHTEFDAVESDDLRVLDRVDTTHYPLHPHHPRTFSYPDDSSGAILSADGWILMTGLLPYGPILPIKPYAVYAPDFIQRYVPEIFPDDITDYIWKMSASQNMTMQAAREVFATTPKTVNDVTVYGGVPKARVSLFPLFHSAETGRSGGVYAKSKDRQSHADSKAQPLPTFEEAAVAIASAGHAFTPSLLQNDYFLWVTNSTQHKNHINALEALDIYYNELGGTLDCYICGPTTQFFADVQNTITYIQTIATKLQTLSRSSQKIMVLGELPAYRFDSVLSNARFLWHNVLYDNGTFSVLEAAELDVPAVVSDYPQMRFICETYGVEPEWFQAKDARGAAKALLMQEQKGRVGASAAAPKGLEQELKACLEGLVQGLMCESKTLKNKPVLDGARS